MALFKKFFYKRPPDRLLEISDRLYVFDCCFSTDVFEEDEYKLYMGGIVAQLQDHFPDASFMVFNFREGGKRSHVSDILTQYGMTVMDYPRLYEGCPLLPLEMMNHFLRSSESWLSVEGQQNVLLMHCERGGWPVLAFMLAALLICKQFSSEHKTLEMVYKQAPRELVHLLSPLNPQPSQLRYLQYISRRNLASAWPPPDSPLFLDCLILRVLPLFGGGRGCRPVVRIYGQDTKTHSNTSSKLLFSTSKAKKRIRFYTQQERALVKIDMHCRVQGDVVLECIHLEDDLVREEMIFRVMFHTAFVRSNILMLGRDEIDTLWEAKDQLPKDFKAEVLFSDLNAHMPKVSTVSTSDDGAETDSTSPEEFFEVEEIFSNILDSQEGKVDLDNSRTTLSRASSDGELNKEVWKETVDSDDINQKQGGRLDFNVDPVKDIAVDDVKYKLDKKIISDVNAIKVKDITVDEGDVQREYLNVTDEIKDVSEDLSGKIGAEAGKCEEKANVSQDLHGKIGEMKEKTNLDDITVQKNSDHKPMHRQKSEKSLPPLKKHHFSARSVSESKLKVKAADTQGQARVAKPTAVAQWVPSNKGSYTKSTHVYYPPSCRHNSPSPPLTGIVKAPSVPNFPRVAVSKDVIPGIRQVNRRDFVPEMVRPPSLSTQKLVPPQPPLPSLFQSKVNGSMLHDSSSRIFGSPPPPPPPPPLPLPPPPSFSSSNKHNMMIDSSLPPKPPHVPSTPPPPPPPPPPPSSSKNYVEIIVPPPAPPLPPWKYESSSNAHDTMTTHVPPPPQPSPFSPTKEPTTVEVIEQVKDIVPPPPPPPPPPLFPPSSIRIPTPPPPPPPPPPIHGIVPPPYSPPPPLRVPTPPPPPPKLMTDIDPPPPSPPILDRATPPPPPPLPPKKDTSPPSHLTMQDATHPTPPPPPPSMHEISSILPPPMHKGPPPPPPPPMGDFPTPPSPPMSGAPPPPPPPPMHGVPLPPPPSIHGAPFPHPPPMHGVPSPPPPPMHGAPPPPPPPMHGVPPPPPPTMHGAPPPPPPPPPPPSIGGPPLPPPMPGAPPPPPFPGGAPPPPPLPGGGPPPPPLPGGGPPPPLPPGGGAPAPPRPPGAPAPPGPPGAPGAPPPPGGRGMGAGRGRGLGGRGMAAAKRSSLKPLHWSKVTRALQGSLWEELQRQETQIVPQFDVSELETLFSAVVPKPADSKSRRKSAGSKTDKVTLVDLRRANNTEIMLTKVKMPLSDMMAAVLAMDDTVLDVDQVENLIKFCPTKEEMDTLKNYTGDKELLGKCEQFFLELMKVPRVESKLRVFAFKIQFNVQISEFKRSLTIVNSACEEVRNSDKFKALMKIILFIGNHLNQGTARGAAVGFKLDSLLKLIDTRANNSKMTLMHYLCQNLSNNHPDLLDFHQTFVNLESASKIQLKSLAEEMQAIVKGLEKVKQELTASENDGAVSEVFCKTSKGFISIAETDVASVTNLYSIVGKNADALVVYFGEDPARCPFEQATTTVLNFVRMFKKAHEENCKQAAELEKKKNAAENEKPKANNTTSRSEDS